MAKRIGIACIVLSFVLYGLLFAVPFLPASTGVKAGVVTGLVISGEIAFWGGGLLLGREVVKKYRSFFSPSRWFGRGRETERKERGDGT
ncbi:transporter suffix domain-containing protein [Paenibacillus sp. TRM 82003]|nr:transporter suffix domain-containing protein [Paenibacillus sp. TRM 82003]